MANILLVDPGDTPRVAMRGIVERGDHRLAAVESEKEAWAFINEQVKVDLVIVDLHLKDGSGLALLKKLRADSQLKGLPVLVYTANGTRNDLHACLELKIQNFLVKPYDEELVFKEIEKAEAATWRAALFEEEHSFCQMMDLQPSQLQEMLRKVRRKIDSNLPALRQWANEVVALPKSEEVEIPALPDEIVDLQEAAESAGAWGVVEALAGVETAAKAGVPAHVEVAFESVELAAHLVDHHLDPDQPCVGFMSEHEVNAQEEEEMRRVWEDAPTMGRCPMVSASEMRARVEAMKGCPVIESASAAFQMRATGHPSCIHPLMDLVARDPGLSAQILVAINQAHPEPDARARLEDPRSAVGQLGEVKLASMSHNLVSISEHTMDVSRKFNWPQYWIYLRTVSRIAQQICTQLELFSLESIARTAGELHDIGKLVIAHLEPIGFRVFIDHARRYQTPLKDVEKLYLDSTSSEIGAHFAATFGLSARLTSVIRWIDDPAQAGDDARLVAVVSLARELVEHAGAGSSGNWRAEDASFMADRTKAWEVLQDCVFPSFNVREFEHLMLARCRVLKSEFMGQGISSRSPLQVA